MSLRSSFVVSPLAAASSACQLPSRKPAASRSRRLSCKATTGDDDAAVVDRRDVLLGLTGLAACSNLGLALAADVVPGCTTVPITDKVLECTPLANDRFYCPAQYNAKEVKDFSELPKSTGRPRVRRAVHLLEPKEVKRFEDAIKKMKELPDSDPRSFRNQRSIHEAYCDKHYNVVTVAADGSKTKVEPFDVHYSSVFAPWHRMYIYFFERILGDLVGDDTFALPYWNWDASDGMIIPSIFMDECSPLYHFDRNPDNVRAFMDLNLGLGKQPKCTTNTLCRQLKDNNLYSMYRQVR
jgi:polyphenol oxidase